MDDYVTKPFNSATIGVALQRALDTSPRAAARSGTPRKRAGPARGKRLAPLLDPGPLGLVAQADPAASKRLAEVFIRNAGLYILELARAEAAGDSASVQRLVHTLKGSAATIGATRMRQSCERLGTAVARGRTVDIPMRQADLEAALQPTKAALQAHGRKMTKAKATSA
jgi:HPt (histidine-containing phosphotransfer) domain-containing protein